MLEMINGVPYLGKYVQNRRFLKNIEGAWNNEVFGGQVFNSVKAACSGIGGLREKRRDGKKVEKTNSLRSKIQ